MLYECPGYFHAPLQIEICRPTSIASGETKSVRRSRSLGAKVFLAVNVSARILPVAAAFWRRAFYSDNVYKWDHCQAVLKPEFP
jgi:hypothetical protein